MTNPPDRTHAACIPTQGFLYNCEHFPILWPGHRVAAHILLTFASSVPLLLHSLLLLPPIVLVNCLKERCREEVKRIKTKYCNSKCHKGLRNKQERVQLPEVKQRWPGEQHQGSATEAAAAGPATAASGPGASWSPLPTINSRWDDAMPASEQVGDLLHTMQQEQGGASGAWLAATLRHRQGPSMGVRTACRAGQPAGPAQLTWPTCAGR
jgi:hypothetical protein